jgi:hypothetical protein
MSAKLISVLQRGEKQEAREIKFLRLLAGCTLLDAEIRVYSQLHAAKSLSVLVSGRKYLLF